MTFPFAGIPEEGFRQADFFRPIGGVIDPAEGLGRSDVVSAPLLHIDNLPDEEIHSSQARLN